MRVHRIFLFFLGATILVVSIYHVGQGQFTFESPGPFAAPLPIQAPDGSELLPIKSFKSPLLFVPANENESYAWQATDLARAAFGGDRRFKLV